MAGSDRSGHRARADERRELVGRRQEAFLLISLKTVLQTDNLAIGE
jgi:hypothetical protein